VECVSLAVLVHPSMAGSTRTRLECRVSPIMVVRGLSDCVLQQMTEGQGRRPIARSTHTADAR